jgi:two-component system, NtrC family, response regulator AtoC
MTAGISDLPPILVCDDDKLVRFTVAAQLRGAGYDVIEAVDGQTCIEAVSRSAPGCVVLDLVMPGVDGLTALRMLRDSGNDVPVVVITATGAVDSAIMATRLGATAWLQKPLDAREVVLAVESALAEDRLKREVGILRERQRSGYAGLIGRSQALQPLFTDLARLENVTAPTVLLLGESGTGKDVVARTIHGRGPRSAAMFVEIDCTALAEPLVESELFGHERGAFTDAKQVKRGLFEVAAGGVVFLDEIGELPPSTQAKLLRAVENRTFKRVGGIARMKLDAGLIAATNRDLKREVDEGRFREDLYYRLNVVTLKIPPLRERLDDIPLLANHFLEQFNRQFGRRIEPVKGETLVLMQAYAWPGNVRELKNVLERIAILGSSNRIMPEDLPPEVRGSSRRRAAPGPASAAQSQEECPFELPESGIDLQRVERGFVVQALERSRGNRTAAARLLGLSRFQLRNRIEKFGLEP